MGLLAVAGRPLSWSETKKLAEYIKEHGIRQFIQIWRQNKDRNADEFKWGDELEYLLIYMPKDKREVRLSLRSNDIQEKTKQLLKELDKEIEDFENITVQPEYGSFMIEATPYKPYGNSTGDLLLVEINMLMRRKWIEKSLDSDERLFLLGSYPLLGSGKYCRPYYEPKGPISQSDYIADEIINSHPRFSTLTKNILDRREKKTDITIPIYPDKNTKLNRIHMDAAAFGMGCCCLQVTFQASSMNDARRVYDQLAMLTPIMMALTAATPFFNGCISNFDCRWTVLSQSADDRTDEEKSRIKKSRYGTLDSFLSNWEGCKDEYNDVNLVYDDKYYQKLIQEGVDDKLAKHISHLFARDPLLIYSKLIEQNDEESAIHFESIQSTNWHNLRFKPPLPNSNTGWRVEFRTMEVQTTEFENAAFSVFIILLSRAILYYNLNFYVPISKIDENFERAHENNAVLNQKFYWRTLEEKSDESPIKELTISQILLGTNEHQGLITIVKKYLNAIGCEEIELAAINEYLSLIEKRASGELLTTAQWLRQYVYDHPQYKQDSIITEEIVYDLLETIHGILHGLIKAEKLLGIDINLNREKRMNTIFNIRQNTNNHSAILTTNS